MNPLHKFQQGFIQLLKDAPRIAGITAVQHFQANINVRGGMLVDGSVQKFSPRIPDTPRHYGRALLVDSGNMKDAIQILERRGNTVTIGINPSQVPYAPAHQAGAAIPVTVKMKKFFWAKYQQSGEQPFWKRLALKKLGSIITIPQRTFMDLTPEVQKEIIQELRSRMQSLTKQQ